MVDENEALNSGMVRAAFAPPPRVVAIAALWVVALAASLGFAQESAIRPSLGGGSFDRYPLQREASLTEALPTAIGLQPQDEPGQSATPQDQEPKQKSALDQAIEGLKDQQSPLDKAVSELGGSQATSPVAAAAPAAGSGGGQLQLMDISLDILTVVGSSTLPEDSIQQLEGGDHDPHKRGFTLQGAELFLQGAVDPYFDAAAGIAYFIDPNGDTVVELEEANFTTRALKHGLQIKAGQFFTEFGRNNPTHPHAWHWIDQPIINSRVFGPDGMRGPGARVSWLLPTERFSQLYFGMQNANGETMASYLASPNFYDERPIGGRPFVERSVHGLQDRLYYARWENSWTDCNEQRTWLWGTSAAVGPNASGSHGSTQIYGTDLTMKCKPEKNERGWPFMVWESEFIWRAYEADTYIGPNPANPSVNIGLLPDVLHDWGFYTQLLYGFKPRWACGLRYEYANAIGDSFDEDFNQIRHNDDPFRDQRHRLSPLIAYYPTEFSRFRLQYNFDYAQHLEGRDAHSIWFGAEVLIGSHPAHKF